MKRPYLVHFIAIKTDGVIALRASISLRSGQKFLLGHQENFTSPYEHIGLMTGHEFRLKVVGLNQAHEKVYSKIFDSDPFGNFQFSIPAQIHDNDLTTLQIFEVAISPGLDYLLGTYIPIEVKSPKKIIVSDFDKTLCDTRYHTTKELYYSITKPLNYFPSISSSIKLLKEYINEGFQPFILTASPHFYEHAIRDWLYYNEIYTAGIFLKDYRSIFSFIQGDLRPKDLKAQGFYKLNHLVNIILMTGLPDELILLGDGFESDTLIYLLLKTLLLDEIEPWSLWNKVRSEDAFQLTTKQNSAFLNKLYKLNSMINHHKNWRPQIKIYIRKKSHQDEVKLPLLKDKIDQVEFYLG